MVFSSWIILMWLENHRQSCCPVFNRHLKKTLENEDKTHLNLFGNMIQYLLLGQILVFLTLMSNPLFLMGYLKKPLKLPKGHFHPAHLYTTHYFMDKHGSLQATRYKLVQQRRGIFKCSYTNWQDHRNCYSCCWYWCRGLDRFWFFWFWCQIHYS